MNKTRNTMLGIVSALALAAGAGFAIYSCGGFVQNATVDSVSGSRSSFWDKLNYLITVGYKGKSISIKGLVGNIGDHDTGKTVYYYVLDGGEDPNYKLLFANKEMFNIAVNDLESVTGLTINATSGKTRTGHYTDNKNSRFHKELWYIRLPTALFTVKPYK